MTDNKKIIVIVGGMLQGTEAAVLARHGGFRTVLVDMDPGAIARNLCDSFLCSDVLAGDSEVLQALAQADLVLPALENDQVLEGLVRLCGEVGTPIAFDLEAYRVTSSKLASGRLLEELGLPVPLAYPEGQAPYIAKPESGSGSQGVTLLETEEEAAAWERKSAAGNPYLVQEYVVGPSYSVEVIGKSGNYRTYVPTEIFTDEDYDCNLVRSARWLEPELAEEIAGYAIKIAEALELKGIMDLEVIDTGSVQAGDSLIHEYEEDGNAASVPSTMDDEANRLASDTPAYENKGEVTDCSRQDASGRIRILEMDARLPSQTPLAVYRASGMNYVQELYDLFCTGDFRDPLRDRGLHSSYCQYLCQGSDIACLGEHIMTEGRALSYDSEAASWHGPVSTGTPAGSKVENGLGKRNAEDALGTEIYRTEVQGSGYIKFSCAEAITDYEAVFGYGGGEQEKAQRLGLRGGLMNRHQTGCQEDTCVWRGIFIHSAATAEDLDYNEETTLQEIIDLQMNS